MRVRDTTTDGPERATGDTEIVIARVNGIRDTTPTNHRMTWGERQAEVLAAASAPRRGSASTLDFHRDRAVSKDSGAPKEQRDTAKARCLAQKDGPATIGGECVPDTAGRAGRSGENFPLWSTLVFDVDPGDCPDDFFEALTACSPRLALLGDAVWHETHSSTPEGRAVRIEMVLKEPTPTIDRNVAGEHLASQLEAAFADLNVDRASLKNVQIMFDPSAPSDAPPRMAGTLLGDATDAVGIAGVVRATRESERVLEEERWRAESLRRRAGSGAGQYRDDGPELYGEWRAILASLGIVVEPGHAKTVDGACICPGASHAKDGVARAEWIEKGVWICRVCGAGGGIVSFVAMLKGCANKEAFNVCRRALGQTERQYAKGTVEGEGSVEGLSEAERTEDLLALAARCKGNERAIHVLVERCREIHLKNRILYAQQRREIATAAGVGVGDLDQAVKGGTAKDAEGPRVEDPFPQLEPYGEQVSGVSVLTELVQYYEYYLILPPDGALLLGLWTLFGFAIDAFDIAPRILVTAPARTCGKSRVLNLISYVCVHVARTASITGAALGRTIELYKPFMLIDEIDTFVNKNNMDLLGILNSGHDRDGAFMVRCVGENSVPTRFSTWAPIVLAGIGGHLPDTTRSRCIPLNMRRKLKTETVARITRRTKEDARTLGAKAMRWTRDHMDELRQADERCTESSQTGQWINRVPDERDGDNWRTLVCVAEVIGGPWWEEAKAAALRATGKGEETDEDASVLLLTDLRVIFGDDESMPTSEIIDRLRSAEFAERPWPTWNKGRGFDPKALAGLLKGYGIRSVNIGPKLSRVRGYLRTQLEAAWTRYAGPVHTDPSSAPPESAAHPAHPSTQHKTSSERCADGPADGTSKKSHADHQAPDGGTAVDEGGAGDSDRSASGQSADGRQRAARGPLRSQPQHQHGLWDAPTQREHPPKGFVHPETGDVADGLGGWVMP